MFLYSPKEWYVINVFTHKEYLLKQYITKYSNLPVNTIVFAKEFFHIYQGKTYKLIKPLFPGYLFVQKYIRYVISIVKTRLKNELFNPINAEGKALTVQEDEMKLLFLNSDKKGIFRLSECYEDGDHLRIMKGPLKNLKGKIHWINKRKKRAKVEISLFQRKMRISLGIDFISREECKYIKIN